MKNPTVFILVLQFNNSQDTVRCLESLKELDYSDFKVIVVDNASKIEHLNNTRFYIESQFNNGKCQLIESKENLGYSGGNNIAIKKALEDGADCILILNPDSTVEKDLLTKLTKKADSDLKIGIVGPAISEEYANKKRLVYGGLIQWLKPELRHLESYLPDANFFISGAAMLVKKSVFEKIDLLDESYFLYFEDADFCVKAKKAGFNLAIVPETEIHHRVSSSTSKLGSALLLRYHYRNSHIFNSQNGPVWVKIALPFWSIFIIIKQLIKLIYAPAKRQISLAILSGIIDFYKGRLGKI